VSVIARPLPSRPPAREAPAPAAGPAPLSSPPGAIGSTPVYVWEVPVRVTHWLIVISIVVLMVTGLYMHGPFLEPASPLERASTMATVRFIHELFAIVFSLSIGVRFYWGFVGNSFSSWRQIVPHRRDQLKSLREMLRYYLFLRRHPVEVIGHNHLAGLAYTLVSVGLFGQVLSGLLLFAWVVGSGPAALLIGWVGAVPGGIQTVRTVHYLLTFVFAAFAIHHVYSAILVDIEERTGVIASIFTGYKNIRWGRPIEGPPDPVKQAPEEAGGAADGERDA
jgi:Ni/Fe-hydrogenase 1 B-type cytochrome subunit